MIHTVYKTTNLLNGKVYVGKHTTDNPNDEYLGSGLALIKAIAKYGKENFVKEILGIFESEDEAYLYESSIVTLDFMKRSDTYNAKPGGRGAKSGTEHSMYDRRGENNPMFGRKHSEETRKKLSERASNRSEETKKKISESQQGEKHFFYGKKRPEHSRIMKERMTGENNPMFGKSGTMLGKYHTEETKEKMKRIKSEAREARIKEYYDNPAICKMCNEVIDISKKSNKTCSKKCRFDLMIETKSLGKHVD